MTVSQGHVQVGAITADDWLVELSLLVGTHGNTNWSTLNVDSAEIYCADMESSGAQNDEIWWYVSLTGGTWDIELLHYQGTNRGIYSVRVDDVEKGTVDGYSASPSRNVKATISSVAISTGRHKISLKMTSKNASSSNYYGTATAIQLRKTSADGSTWTPASSLSGISGGYAPLSSGLLVPASYLGTGTANKRTVLHGDGVYRPRFGLDRGLLDSTYGDDFDESSLNARWSRHNQTSGQETYQVGGRGSALQVAHGGTNAAEYIYQTDPNNTNQTWEASFSLNQETSTGQMFGIIEVTSAGTGVAIMLYDNAQSFNLVNVSSHTYSSVITADTSGYWYAAMWQHMSRVWLRLRKASGVYFASMSFDGEIFSPELSGTPSAFTPTRIGVGRFLGTNASTTAYWHHFDKTA